MTDLASAADVASELGLDGEGYLSDAQVNRVPSLLIKASSLFRKAAGRQFTEATYTQRLQVIGGRVRPPEQPVNAVDSAVDDSGNTVTFTLKGDCLDVSRHHDTDASFAWYRPEDRESGWFVTVTYTGGAVPDDVRVTVAQIVARQLNADPTAATGVRSHEQTAGPFTERKQFFDWAAETVALTDEERAFAESFRYPATARIVHRSC